MSSRSTEPGRSADRQGHGEAPGRQWRRPEAAAAAIRARRRSRRSARGFAGKAPGEGVSVGHSADHIGSWCFAWRRKPSSPARRSASSAPIACSCATRRLRARAAHALPWPCSTSPSGCCRPRWWEPMSPWSPTRPWPRLSTIHLFGERFAWLAIIIVAPLIWDLRRDRGQERVPAAGRRDHAGGHLRAARRVLACFLPILAVFSVLTRTLARLLGGGRGP